MQRGAAPDRLPEVGGFGLARLANRARLERQRYTTKGECTPDWAKSALI